MKLRYFAALLFSLAVLGCAHQITGYAEQPQLTTRGANHKQVLVHFHDVPDVETLQFYCNQPGAESLKYGCAEYYPPNDPAYPDRALVIIYSLLPSDFNDAAKLALWGHELAHGRGWAHK